MRRSAAAAAATSRAARAPHRISAAATAAPVAAARPPQWVTRGAEGAPRAVTACLTQRISPRGASVSTVPLRSGSALRARGAPFAGFELLFLGTSAGSPSVRRNPSALCLRLAQHAWLFDCAEGSLRQLMKSAVRVPLANKFFITHLHGDHLYGLPGILCTLDNHNADFLDTRTRKHVPRPIAVYGPLGLFAYLNTAFATSSTRMANLAITVHELVSPEMLKKASKHERFMRRAPTHPVRACGWCRLHRAPFVRRECDGSTNVFVTVPQARDDPRRLGRAGVRLERG